MQCFCFKGKMVGDLVWKIIGLKYVRYYSSVFDGHTMRKLLAYRCDDEIKSLGDGRVG